MQQNKSHAYRIKTPRLLLRCWEIEDAPRLAEAIRGSLEHLRPWMTWATPEQAELDTVVENITRNRASFEQGDDRVYGILSLDGLRVLGGCGLHARGARNMLEIGYWIRAEETGRGYATEAAEALTRVGFEHFQMMKMEIHCAAGNLASAAVARRLDYRLEGTLRYHRELYGGTWTDTLVWGLLSEEFPASLSAGLKLEALGSQGERLL